MNRSRWHPFWTEIKMWVSPRGSMLSILSTILSESRARPCLPTLPCHSARRGQLCLHRVMQSRRTCCRRDRTPGFSLSLHVIGQCTQPRRQQGFLLPSMPHREDKDENCFRLEQCVLSMVAQLESGGEARSQAKPAVAHFFVFSFFVSQKVGRGLKAEFH